MKFDEFSLVLIGGIIFLGIVAIAFTTSSEFPPKVSPATVSLTLDPGGFETFDINVTGKITEVNISTSGEIASWILPTRTDLGAIGGRDTVPITLSVPTTATPGAHTGKIIVRSKEGKAEVDVTVTISSVKKLSARTVPLGEFKTGYFVGSRELAARDKSFVSKSYLFEKPVNMLAELTAEEVPIITGGAVRFVIDDTNNYGAIIVTQNGREIFKEVAGPGQVVAPLNISEMRKSNTISIRADYPGIFFWAENLYGISNVSVDASFKGALKKEFNFTLVPEEYTRFDHVQITYTVKSASANLPPMKITLNDKTIFFGVPPRTTFNREFSRDTFGGVVSMGPTNTLSFSFDQESSYEISGATLAVFSRAVS